MTIKMTNTEKKWVLYDVGNSAFTLLISTIMPIYFNYLAENAGLTSVEYLAYWGYAASIATIIVAVLVAGNFCWNVSGRHTGIIQVLFCKDYSC